MAKFILGTKEGMSQLYTDDGALTAVTLVKVEPNVVVQVKTKEKDGYEAVQIGTGSKRNLPKALKGHMGDLGLFAHLREFPFLTISEEGKELSVGDSLDVNQFAIGDSVKVMGTGKGKGFAGVVKRHGFKGAHASHGHKKVLRRPGSIGQRFPQHTLKGLRMAGRDGGGQVTVRNLKVVAVDVEAGVLALKGAVPGTKGRLVAITTLS
jgi:large subunit ribosomal protein L3